MTSKKCKINCCVYGCRTKKGREKNLSFHRFPQANFSHVYITNKLGIQEKVDRKKAWERVLLMGKPASNTMRVCSLHFVKENYMFPDYPTKIRRLRNDAVPTQNLPEKSLTTEPNSSTKNENCSRRRSNNRSGKEVHTSTTKEIDTEDITEDIVIPFLPFKY
ncbi:hypothetical protein FQA39_LY15369 [Lamprigera yunnana]|nr:hypothetical protein FQA39_LY15369 [Lamprigera yunnana]